MLYNIIEFLGSIYRLTCNTVFDHCVIFFLLLSINLHHAQHDVNTTHYGTLYNICSKKRF